MCHPRRTVRLHIQDGWSGADLHRATEQAYRVAKKNEPKQDETPDFEQSLQELEAIVARLEQGDLPLEESLRQFERGIALTRACQQSLKTAEQKVQILIEENGKTDTRAFTDVAED